MCYLGTPMKESFQPLAGVRVVDFSQNLPGPYASLVLASWGANVVKVESPRGDPARATEPFFSMVNRGKRSVVLDLRDGSGDAHARLQQLLEWADVLIEGFRPGTMKRLGAGFEEARAINPELVYCSISAYGQQGERRLEPAHDLNLQALSGLSELEALSSGQPRGSHVPVSDVVAAWTAISAIVAALRDPASAPHLDVAMLDGAITWAQLIGKGIDLRRPAEHALRNKLPRRLSHGLLEKLDRLKLFAIPHYGVFRAADGRWIAIGVVDEMKFWRGLCEVLRLERLKKLSLSARIALSPFVRQAIAYRIRSRSSAHWLRSLKGAGLPVTRVRNAARAVDDAQVHERGLLDAAGFVQGPLSAKELSRAPALGADNEGFFGP